MTKTKDKRISVRLETTLWSRFGKKAKAEKRKLSEKARMLIEDYTNNKGA